MDREWKPVPGYEGWYLISDDGYVMRTMPGQGTTPGRMLSPATDRGGYEFVGLSRNGEVERGYIHSLVMAAFHGRRPEGYEVNHIDGDKTHNSYSNLEYVTRSEHMRHSIDELGLYNHARAAGENHGNATLSDAEAVKIKRLYETGKYSYKDLASMFDCGKTTVARIAREEGRFARLFS